MNKKEDEFIKVNANLSRAETKKAVERAQHSFREWLYIAELCRIKRSLGTTLHLRNLRIAALDQAIKKAASLDEWLLIAGSVKGPLKEKAIKEITKLNLSEKDANFLIKLRSMRLRSFS